MAKRTKPRTGRPLKGFSAHDLVPHSDVAAQMHQELIAEGFRLQRGCRPYLRKDWMVSMRFVWRHRQEERTVTLSLVCPAGVADGGLVIGVGDGMMVGQTWGASMKLEAANV